MESLRLVFTILVLVLAMATLSFSQKGDTTIMDDTTEQDMATEMPDDMTERTTTGTTPNPDAVSYDHDDILQYLFN